MSLRKKVSMFDEIEAYNNRLSKLKDNLLKLSKDDLDKQFDKCIKTINSESMIYDLSDKFNTNSSSFTNDKKCNNVIYTGNYSSNLSRSSSNTVNGITYGPTIF